MTTGQRVTGARPGGRSARVRAAVQAATLDELAAVGYADLTIEAVAERAGVNRTTIYRRWPNKRSLVLGALLDYADDQLSTPDTGDLGRDLHLLGQTIDRDLGRPQAHALMHILVADRPGSSELSDVRAQLWADRLRQAHAIPRRAIERGELAPDTDLAAVIDMLVGPIYLRRFIQGRPMTANEIDDLATRVVAAFAPRGATGRNGLTGAPFSQNIVAMTSRISHMTVDAIDAYAQSVWWSKVLDFVEDADDPNEPGHELCPIMSRDRSQVLLFITVPDGRKKLKNRLHLDLRPVGGTRDQEVERLLALGASQAGDFRRPDGRGWITLTDPEGNEFCVLPPDQATSSPIS
jgi:AcrR family transcriptional regulator